MVPLRTVGLMVRFSFGFFVWVACGRALLTVKSVLFPELPLHSCQKTAHVCRKAISQMRCAGSLGHQSIVLRPVSSLAQYGFLESVEIWRRLTLFLFLFPQESVALVKKVSF